MFTRKPNVLKKEKILINYTITVQEEWYACQQTWMYLEVIFSAPDIQRQLPNETRLFTIVDKSLKDIMRKTAKV